MGDDLTQRAKALRDQITADEKYAEELAGFAAHARAAGYDEAAQRLLSFSRRYRIVALDHRGRLAAITSQIE